MIQEERIQAAVATILESIGDDPMREGLKGTSQRVARMYGELFSGVGVDPRSALDAVFEEDGQRGEAVIIRDVDFFSTCEHHLLPFFGRVHIGYIPDGKIAGVSKLVRALEVVSRRLQVQERMTNQLADAIYDVLQPDGAAVVVEAQHLCMSMRGVKKPGSLVVTSVSRGPFDQSGLSRSEFLATLQKG